MSSIIDDGGLNASRKRVSIAHVVAVFVIWLVLFTGLAVAGTLTVSLEPSLLEVSYYS